LQSGPHYLMAFSFLHMKHFLINGICMTSIWPKLYLIYTASW
jgi:hypothetical protein